MQVVEEVTKGKKKLSGLKDNIQKVVILLVSILYIFQGLFNFTKRDASLIVVLGSIAMSVAVGMILSSQLNLMGLKDGRRSEIFISSLKLYGEVKEKATKYLDKLQSWCNYKTAMELENKKKDIIQKSGLKWKLYKIGYYSKYPPIKEEEIKALEHANNCKIEQLTQQDLLSDLPSAKVMKGKRFGDGEKEFMMRNTIIDGFSRVAIGICFGLFTLTPLITGENAWAKLTGMFVNAMQVSMWLALGILKYVSSKSFMEDEYRQTHIIQKVEYLNEFYVTMENNPHVIDEYDEDKDIDKYIDELMKDREIKNGQETTEILN